MCLTNWAKNNLQKAYYIEFTQTFFGAEFRAWPQADLKLSTQLRMTLNSPPPWPHRPPKGWDCTSHTMAGKTVQWLRALSASAEDPGFSSQHPHVSHNPLTSIPGDLKPSPGFLRCQVCTWGTCRQTLICIKQTPENYLIQTPEVGWKNRGGRKLSSSLHFKACAQLWSTALS